MSTRCQVGFYEGGEESLSGFTALVYKHSDGYPDGVLPLLEKFCREFNASRGLSDAEYAAAWYVADLCNEQEEFRKKWHKEWNGNKTAYKRDFLGVGICKDFHGDIEYFYAVRPNRIEVYDVSGAPGDEAKPIQTIELK